MKRLSLGFLVVLGLLLTLTPVISAYAKVQLPAYIKFEGYASGACFLMYGYQPTDPKDWPVQPPPIWCGLAHGSITLEGYAKATAYEESWGYIAEAGNVKALGSMAVKWSEADGLHQLWIIIYSNPETRGVLGPSKKEGGFFIGFAPPPGSITDMLGYTGVYMTGEKVQCTSGEIWVCAGIWPHTDPHPEFVQVYLRSGDSAMLLMWVGETTSVYINWPPWTFTLPAAETIVRNVKLL